MLGSALALTACSDSYLDLESESDLNTSQVFANTDMLDGAVNGLALIMSDSYSSSGFGMQGYNGEATISLWYGDYKSGDAQYSNATSLSASYLLMVNSTHNETVNSHLTYYPWYYYYMLISNANAIIDHAYEASGSDDKKDFYVAQALTLRAHAYTQLVALYSKRWDDSRNGASRGVPLRLDESNGSLACSSLGEVYDQIYADLDRALELYSGCTTTRGDMLWRPDASVAHGIYSRAALAKQDWQKAADHAAAARKGYTLMDEDDYWDGFNTPNSEWMWETYHDETENLGVYGFFAYVGCNTPSSKGYKNIGSIDKTLCDMIPDSDSRKEIFLVPLDEEYGQGWWSTTDSGTIWATKKDSKEPDGYKHNLMYDRITSEYYDRLLGTDGKKIYTSGYQVPYMSTKFMSIADRSIGNVCLMRAAEMIYNEAEALCMLGGNDTKVQQLMQQAQKAYQPSYTCNKTGKALLDEVKLYKRFDLWGEGRHYFDQKRWNVPMERKTWDNGSNWHPSLAGASAIGGSYGVHDRNNWCICIPAKETDYNDLISANIEPEDWTKDGKVQ